MRLGVDCRNCFRAHTHIYIYIYIHSNMPFTLDRQQGPWARAPTDKERVQQSLQCDRLTTKLPWTLHTSAYIIHIQSYVYSYYLYRYAGNHRKVEREATLINYKTISKMPKNAETLRWHICSCMVAVAVIAEDSLVLLCTKIALTHVGTQMLAEPFASACCLRC